MIAHPGSRGFLQRARNDKISKIHFVLYFIFKILKGFKNIIKEMIPHNMSL